MTLAATLAAHCLYPADEISLELVAAILASGNDGCEFSFVHMSPSLSQQMFMLEAIA